MFKQLLNVRVKNGRLFLNQEGESFTVKQCNKRGENTLVIRSGTLDDAEETFYNVLSSNKPVNNQGDTYNEAF